MHLLKSSLILDFFARFGISWEFSRTRKLVDGILRFWDRLVSGSLFVSWLTGSDVFPIKITNKPSLFALEIQKCWQSFLGFIRKASVDNKNLKSSALSTVSSTLRHYFQDHLFSGIGWLGCAFFPFYGTLRLLFSGISTPMLIFVISGFLVSILLVLTNVKLTELIKSSRLLGVIDDLDQ